MSDYETVALCPSDAAALLARLLARAQEAAGLAGLDAALDGWTSALGIALQLGPAAVEQVLRAVLAGAAELERRAGPDALAAVGPALVHVISQVDEAEALPETPVMEAWASVATDIAALLGQVGIALAVPDEHRAGLIDSARLRAALLDDATGALFELADWVDRLSRAPGRATAPDRPTGGDAAG